MFDIDKWREIFQTLMRNKSRSLLTAFGIFWGVFMLVLLMGGAKGMKAMMQSNFEGFAQNAYCAAPEKTTKPYDGLSSDRMWSFETGDLDVLRRHIPEAAVVTPVIFNRTDFKHRDSKTQGTAKGVSPDYVAVENPKLSHGRYIQEADLRDCRKVCVLGEKMASQLFPNDRNPVGKWSAFLPSLPTSAWEDRPRGRSTCPTPPYNVCWDAETTSTCWRSPHVPGTPYPLYSGRLSWKSRSCIALIPTISKLS